MAAAPAAPASGVKVIIWGGGASAAEAEKELAAWKSENEVLSGLVALAPGFPRVIESKTVPGLKPGFHVVLLGACTGSALDRPLHALQGLRKGVYARPGALPAAGACPTLQGGFEPLELERTKKGSAELTMIGFLATKSAQEHLPWSYRFIQRDATGAMMSWLHMENTAGAVSGCDVPQSKKASDGFTLSLECVGPGPGPAPQESRVTLSYLIGAKGITFDVKRIP
jgi:hypothetical protein